MELRGRRARWRICRDHREVGRAVIAQPQEPVHAFALEDSRR